MAPVASSLASKLHLWVKTDDTFTTDGKIIICLACNRSIGCTMKSQRATYKEQAIEFSKKRVLSTQMQQSSTKRNEFFKDMCNWFVSANIPWFKLQMPEFRSLLEKYYKQHISVQSTCRKRYISICYEEPWKTQGVT
jgi:hypothetical protein